MTGQADLTTRGVVSTRGVVLAVSDIVGWNWPAAAATAGLNTIATHGSPSEIVLFMQSEAGKAFRTQCSTLGIAVEHELHALRELLPRDLFAKDASLFRMTDDGHRVPDANLCVHSKAALDICCERAVELAKALKPTTGRYFFWPDDGQPMCRCPRCRAFSDSDQALIFENRLLTALRAIEPSASVAHLAYANTFEPPSVIRPEPGIFLEFAPILRRYDLPLCERPACLEVPGSPNHRMQLDTLDRNLAVFGTTGAQALEYWLDVSRFSNWTREKITAVPWNRAVVESDVDTYRRHGVVNMTTFAVWMDAEYVQRFGIDPLREYGATLSPV